jgi:ABC-type dipeptide/oligopeptide/nickel transport system permease component
MPNFWLGLVLIFVFGYHLGWFPPAEGRLAAGIPVPERVTGFYTIDSLLAGDLRAFRSALAQMMAPAITVAMGLVAVVIRMLRAGMLEELGKDYVRTGRSKGLSPAHGLLQARAAQRHHPHHHRRQHPDRLPARRQRAGGGGLRLAGGRALLHQRDQRARLQRRHRRDLLIAVVFALINLFVDVLNAFIDPRIHYG